MNSAVLNLAALDDSNEVWSWYGNSSMAVQASGAIQFGLTLSGSASVQMVAAGGAVLYATPSFTPAGIALTASGVLTYGATGAGQATLKVSSDGDGTRWALGQSASQILFQAAGDAQVVTPIASSFVVVVSTSIDPRVTQAIPGEGASSIVLSASLEPHIAKAGWLASDSTKFELATIATPYLVVDSPAGNAALRLLADGDARFGGKVQLEPMPAELGLFASGELGYQHYVYASGEAQITVESAAARHGIPQIPSNYIAAPGIRMLRVDNEQRRFIVPAERRL